MQNNRRRARAIAIAQTESLSAKRIMMVTGVALATFAALAVAMIIHAA